MKYYSEDTVDKILRELISGKKVFLSNYSSVVIPSIHDDLIEKTNALGIVSSYIEAYSNEPSFKKTLEQLRDDIGGAKVFVRATP